MTILLEFQNFLKQLSLGACQNINVILEQRRLSSAEQFYVWRRVIEENPTISSLE